MHANCLKKKVNISEVYKEEVNVPTIPFSNFLLSYLYSRPSDPISFLRDDNLGICPPRYLCQLLHTHVHLHMQYTHFLC